MKRISVRALIIVLLGLLATVALSSLAAGQVANPPVPAQHQSHLKQAAKVTTYPVVHPKRTVKAVLYGLLHIVGVATDTVEKVTTTVSKGASKADSAVDAAEDASKP